jgi:hypothetical protein
LIFYLTSIGSMQDEAKWGAFALMAVLAFAWVQIGHREKVANLAPRTAVRPAKTLVEEEVEEELEEQQSNIPAPVKAGSLDGTTLKQRKMAKVQAANADKALAMAEADASDVEEMDVVVEMEEVHVADEFVIEVSPESIEDADIDVTVNQKRIEHAEIRQRIEKRRRGHLAEIRASTVKMQQQQDVGEDLVALLQTAGHGHSVLDEPLNPAPGHVYGATFIRIDESRILKLRTALDTGFEAVEKPEEVLPQLIGIDGNPLPALLGPDGKPLPMPLPMPGASGALAAMKSEIRE